MTARIAGFVTRADAGLRSPRSISRNITPDRGGVGVHYGGGRQSAAEPASDHARCLSTWRAWQTYHMNTHGWADIAYTGGFCNHGFAFAGRGVGIRTAANGTNSGNQNYYAVTWIGGEGQTPTPEALDAADWWIDQLRQNGAGRAVKPHRFFKSTGCPGAPLVVYSANRDGADLGGSISPPPPPPPPDPAKPGVTAPPFPLPRGWYFGPRSGPRHSVSGYYSYRNSLRQWQQQMINRGWNLGRSGADGLYGPDTERVTRAFQREKNLGVDGLIGPQTWNAAWTAPIT